MKRFRAMSGLGTAGLVVAVWAGTAYAAESGDYGITSGVFDAGYGTASFGPYSITSATGQSTVAGNASSTDYAVTYGFPPVMRVPSLCGLGSTLLAQLDLFRDDFGIVSDDFDDDGVPEEFVLALVEFFACSTETSVLRSATLDAFETNLDALDSEADSADVAPYRELLAVLLLVSQHTQDVVIALLDGAGISLTGTYAVVVTPAARYLPPNTESASIEDLLGDFAENAKTVNEPYSGAGDVDGDGTSNAIECCNVIVRHGTVQDFVNAATNPNLDGTGLGCGCDGEGNPRRPDAPANVQASDGTFPYRVRVTWDAVQGAQEYRVYRDEHDEAPHLLATVDGRLCDDFTTGTSTEVWVDRGGCLDIFGYQTTLPDVRIYWVATVNECGQSNLSDPDLGHRALEKGIFEKVLPVASRQDGKPVISADSPISIRLRAKGLAGVAGIWGLVSSSALETTEVEWVPINDHDGWVVYRPHRSWPSGDVVTMTVGGTTVLGDTIEPITYTFMVEGERGDLTRAEELKPSIWQPSYRDFDAGSLDLAAESNSVVTVSEVDDHNLLLSLTGAVGVPYALAPAQVFEVPQRVWLPVPAGQDSTDLAIYYHYATEPDMSWYPGENVEGWLVPDSYLELQLAGVTYFGFLVQHGGIVQLAVAGSEPATVDSAAVVTTPPADAVVLGLIMAGLLFAAKRVTRKRRRT